VHAQVPANVTTGHDDNARTGLNAQETTLTPANVNSTTFGKLFSVPVDGYVYAQPLYLSNVSIANVTHNVVYVVTEHDSAYAIDADNGSILWQVSFINPSAGVTTVPSGDVACGDLTPEIGITSTPAIDTASGTIYLLARTKENGSYVQRLHALDVTTGVEQPGSPVTISASVNGNGDGSSGGTISFDPFLQHNRPGLLLQNGHVLIGWASLCDRTPYHGWVMSYNASSLAQEAVFNTTPNGGLGGIWMSGAGLAGDSSFNTYFATGNGTYNGSTDFGDSVVKLAPPNGNSFPLSDWFTPFDQGSLDSGDIDLGSGGVLLLPDQPLGSPHQHLLLQAGKEGTLYLIDRDNMGHFNPNDDSQIVQSLRGALPGLWGLPAWWNNNVYVAGSGDVGGPTDHLKAFAFDTASGLLSASPTSQSLISFASPGPTPSVSANGTANGIVWVLQNDQSQSSGQSVLRAFDATDLSKELYNSQQNAARDNPGPAVKFTLPTVVNGKVYLGTQTQLSVYGELSPSPILVNSGGPAYTDSVGQVWSADTNFSGGSTYTVTSNIASTSDPTLYQTERWGSFSYSFTVPAGAYTVTLKFAETSFTDVGQRVFNVAINGTMVLSNFDILARAGGANIALDQAFQVNSTGAIMIEFIPGSADQPKVDAIQITP
jgi:hypothetical protein